MDENSPQSQWNPQSTPEDEANNGLPDFPTVTWTASEFISHQKTSSWYVIFGIAAAVVTFIVVIVSGEIMPGVVVAAASIALAVSAARKPETKQYQIDQTGVSIEGRSYGYDIFKSFSVVEEGAVSSIWLRPLRRLTPTMVIYFAPEDEQKIIDTLENFLPEEARDLDVFDRASRRLRF